MMTSENENERWQRLLRGFRDGDPQMVQEFWEHYGPLLHQVADKHLGARLRRRLGPEDVVQSACRTFLRRARQGEFRLADSAALWRLLCAITLTKIREQARFHQRQKRGLGQEVQAVPAPGQSGVSDFDLADPNPTPATAAAFADQFEKVMASFDEEEQQVVDLKLQEYTHEEVAQRLGLSERTVRRIVKRVQTRLARAFVET